MNATFITRYEPKATGVRLAVKDLIDIAGEPTTAGCRALADLGRVAGADAACLAGARAAKAAIVGKTNLHELAFGATGKNPWYGTPVNPLDPSRVPGGSSSGSAVAVATHEADVALGTDTGGSVRVPSACCGTAGLKTTWGRVPLAGVWPLSTQFDTVGPMARDVVGLVAGMQLLEPGFRAAGSGPVRVGRLRLAGSDPAVDKAVDRVLAESEWDLADVTIDEWQPALGAHGSLLLADAWVSDRELVEQHGEGVSEPTTALLRAGAEVDEQALAAAREVQDRLRSRFAALFGEVELLATPTMPIFAPSIEEADDLLLVDHTMPVNLAGLPALAQPVPSTARLPASLQLIGPAGSEELLLAAGAVVEAAAGSL